MEGSINHIKVKSIRKNPDNPNPHSEEKIETLAANIKEFGLMNPITVKPISNGNYEIIAGEGRFEAIRKLGWTEVPCTITPDSSDYKDWGRRLSENKLRSFTWVAECIELANMKAEGKSWSELGKLFGFPRKTVDERIAVGECLKGINLATVAKLDILNYTQFLKYILTLRNKNDLSEVQACMDKLASGELSLQELPSYSYERRLAMVQSDLEKEYKKSLKDSEERLAEKIKEDYIAKILGLEEKRQELEETLREEMESQRKTVKDLEDKHQKALDKIKKSTDADKTLTDQLQKEAKDLADKLEAARDLIDDMRDTHQKRLKEQENKYEKRMKALEFKMESLPDKLRKEIEKEVESKKQEEYEKELQKRANELAKKEKELKNKEKELSEKDKDLENEREKYAKKIDIEVWIGVVNKLAIDLSNQLGYARRKGFWGIFAKNHFQMIASNLMSLNKEMVEIVHNLKERKLIK